MIFSRSEEVQRLLLRKFVMNAKLKLNAWNTQLKEKSVLVSGEENQSENAELFVEKGVKMQNLNNYIFLDFETTGKDLIGRYYFDPDVSKQDAVQIALVWFEDGEYKCAHSYIKPPDAYFNLKWSHASPNPEFCKNAPKLKDLYPILVGLIGKKTIVAHNASFDKKVMEDTLDLYNKPYLPNEWLCTKDLAKQYFVNGTKCFDSCKSNCSGFTLSHIHHEFGFGDYKEHDAIEDTFAVAKIFEVLNRGTENQKKSDWIFV